MAREIEGWAVVSQSQQKKPWWVYALYAVLGVIALLCVIGIFA